MANKARASAPRRRSTRQRAKAAANGRGNGRPKAPNAVSKRDLSGLIAEQLFEIQSMRTRIEILKLRRDAADEDPLPGVAANPDGTMVTFGGKIAELNVEEDRIVSKHRDLMPMVDGYLAGLHARQEAESA